MKENKQLDRKFWGRHIWARGYFVAAPGNITKEVIMKYIKHQDIGDGSGRECATVK